MASKKGISKRSKRGKKTKVKKTDDQWVTVAQFAKAMGVIPPAVYQAIDSGRIQSKKIGRGKKVNLKQASEAWETNRKRYPQNQDVDDADEADLPETFDDNAEITPKNAVLHRMLASAKREKWLARKAELEFKESAGQLVSAEKVKRQAFELARRTRDHILNLPDRISADLVGITDQAAMHSKLTQELTAALSELADGKDKIKAKKSKR